MQTAVNPLIVGEIGSYAHGLNTPNSDHDYIGLYLDPPETLIGLTPPQKAIRERDKPEGTKSQAGDKETTYYSLKHYAKLAADGNPTVLTLLYTPNLTVPDTIGLQANRDMFLSKRLVARHIGYADNMTARLTGQKAPRTNRPELIEAHGYDVKAAFHAIRLLMQGHELLSLSNMQMPMRDKDRQILMSVRNGEITKSQALTLINNWKIEIQTAEWTTNLPDHPDYNLINKWLIDIHQTQWEST